MAGWWAESGHLWGLLGGVGRVAGVGGASLELEGVALRHLPAAGGGGALGGLGGIKCSLETSLLL